MTKNIKIKVNYKGFPRSSKMRDMVINKICEIENTKSLKYDDSLFWSNSQLWLFGVSKTEEIGKLTEIEIVG